MTRMSVLLALPLFLGCADSTAPSVLSIELARARWQAQAITNYDFDLRHTNEWFPPRTVRISVRDGVRTRMVDLASGEDLPLSDDTIETIPDLFDLAIRARSETGAILEVEFDIAFSYLSRIFFDHPEWADESYSYEVLGLVQR